MGQIRHGHTIGQRITPEYRAYQNAKNRCTNPNADKYSNYGGRGIKFSFVSFKQWYAELGEKPEPKHLYSVDRIGNDGHYEIGNVRWATKKDQANNRHTVLPSFLGRHHSEETKANLRTARVGKPWPEARQCAQEQRGSHYAAA